MRITIRTIQVNGLAHIYPSLMETNIWPYTI